MRAVSRNIFLAFAAACALSCSGIQPDETASADLNLGEAPVEIDFEADVNTSQYHELTFSNNSADNYEIVSLAFVDNDCGAFSVFDITDESGNILYQSGDEVAVGVVSGASVNIHIEFSPTACEVTNYATTLIIYYQANGATLSRTAILNAIVTDTTVNIVCEESDETVQYNDELGDPTPSRKLPALSEGEYYYLKVERMRAYIQPTGGFTSLATKVGTDINIDQIADEDLFVPVYLPFTTDDSGNVTLLEIDECDGFAIPSPVADQFFWGASVILTTTGETTGTVERTATGSIGEVNFPNFNVRLFSSINNSASLIQDDEGRFGVNITTALTTSDSATNDFLADIADVTDDDGEAFMNVVASGSTSVLSGSDLYHGTATFVGVGTFEGTDAMLSPEATSALLENEAYIFIQIDAKVVTKK